MNKLRPIERAYISGVFDGEGCVYFRDDRHRRPALSISQKDPEVLQWIQGKLGFGRLYARSDAACWTLNFNSSDDVLAFIDVVYKYSIVKRRGLSAAKRNLQKRPVTKTVEQRIAARRKQLGLA